MARQVSGLDIDDLLKFDKKLLNLVEKQMPKEIPKHMKKSARKAAKILQKQGKAMVGTSKNRKDNQKNKSYHRGWTAGKKVYEYQGTKYNIRAYNRAPHSHLIEYGHRIVKDGKVVGFVSGRFVVARSLGLIEPVFYRDTEQYLNKLIETALNNGLSW